MSSLTPSFVESCCHQVVRVAQLMSRTVNGIGLDRHARLQSAKNKSNPNAIYIWIPKTAGSSLNTTLTSFGSETFLHRDEVRKRFSNRGTVTFGHMSVAKLLESGLLDAAYYSASWKFAFVRDPFDRAVSLFEYLHQLGRLPPSTSFSTFCCYIDRSEYEPVGLINHDGLSQLNPQVAWLKDDSGNLIADFIGRFEALLDGVDVVMDKLNVPVEKRSLGHHNSSGRKVALSSYYGPSEIEIIQRVYHDDFESFGYPLVPDWL